MFFFFLGGGFNLRDFCKTSFLGICFFLGHVIPVMTFGWFFAMGRYNRFEFWDEGRPLG